MQFVLYLYDLKKSLHKFSIIPINLTMLLNFVEFTYTEMSTTFETSNPDKHMWTKLIIQASLRF